MTRKTDPYQRHRAVLAPLLPHATSTAFNAALSLAADSGEHALAAFIQQQGLAPLWATVLEKPANHTLFSAPFRQRIHQQRLHATGLYLAQRQSLALTQQVLHNAGLVHAVIKGADARERYYAEGALRPAVDIDLLVAEQGCAAAIQALRRAGFTLHMDAKNISHEACLVKDNAIVDLHWDILRPGRTRQSMVAQLLATRVKHSQHWGLSHEGNLFLMLVHPVFAKYSTTPQASLVRLLDIAYLLQAQAPDWNQIIAWLDAAGLKTSGWITLSWLRLVTGLNVDPSVYRKLAPGTVRARYLTYWLENDLASRLLARPLLVQAGFTLAAHDRLSDAFTAIKGQYRAKQGADLRCQALEALTR